MVFYGSLWGLRGKEKCLLREMQKKSINGDIDTRLTSNSAQLDIVHALLAVVGRRLRGLCLHVVDQPRDPFPVSLHSDAVLGHLWGKCKVGSRARGLVLLA